MLSCEYRRNALLFQPSMCQAHEANCHCLLALMEKKRRSVVEVNVPPSVDFRCQIPTKPPKPRCQTCKLGLTTCWNHMVPCCKPAWSACHFCSRFICHSDVCQEKICCDGKATRIAKLEKERIAKLEKERQESLALTTSLKMSLCRCRVRAT